MLTHKKFPGVSFFHFTLRTWRLVIAFALFVSFPLLAPNLFFASGISNDSSWVAHVEAQPSYDPASPGLDFWVAVQLNVQKDWHVNAAYGIPQGLIPAAVKNSDGSVISGIRAPSGTPKALASSTEPFPVYEGSVTIFIPVRIPPGAPNGPLTLQYGLDVQACNDQICLPPSTLAIQVPIHVAAQGKERPAHLDWFVGLSQPVESPEENIIAKLIRQKGWWLTFVLVLVGGLALNLTPCVYPMIPLTVAYFGTRKDDGPAKMLFRAAAYVLGISATYTALGVTAALTGRLFGSALQSPMILVGISAVLVTLSFSMFGLYEIQAPAWLLNRIGGSTATGVVGAFSMGLVFGAVAAPCVDPFSIGLLTFVAAKADVALGFALFFTLSLGLGLPYLLLGFFSGEIQRLPKSGLWMVWVKKVFGFVLLGMPMYFLHPYLPDHILPWLLAAYLTVVGLLLGWVFSGAGVPKGFDAFQKFFGTAIAIMGVVLFLFWPKPTLTPFEPYTPARLQEAQKAGQKVLLDFSAAWCIPCRELETKTFSDPKVRESLKGWVLLKADLTRFDEGDVKVLRKKWNVSGVPTILLIGPSGQVTTNGRMVGYISPYELLPLLHEPR
jgi:thiol:disulfide interchange protein DsbD